jgi:hypothetical protein
VFANSLCDVGGVGITVAEGLHDWGWRTMALLNYAPAFAIQPWKSAETLSKLAESLRLLPTLTWLSLRVGWLLSFSSPRLPLGTSVNPRTQVFSDIPH